jgi:CRP/FNR family transcriptional regulator, anaerobic regulatory protein
MPADWTSGLPSLNRLDEAARIMLREHAQRIALPRGSVVFRAGDRCGSFPMIASGCIRVQRITESGREIVLYRVVPDETCILTTACLLSAEAYSAEGVVESDIIAYAVSAERFKILMDRSAAFRTLVFEGYSKRIASLMSRVEEIACTRIDVRLAERLLDLARTGSMVATTQQALAADLGTAREVVGRALKSFERSGWIHISRGHLDIVDRTALAEICRSERD